MSPTLASRFFTTETPGKPTYQQINGCKTVVHTMENYSPSKGKEILTQAITQMNLEGIMLVEIIHSQRNKCSVCVHVCVCVYVHTHLLNQLSDSLKPHGAVAH